MPWLKHENRAFFKRGVKRCSKCRKVKKLEDFHRAPKRLYFTGRKSACKACFNIKSPVKSCEWEKIQKRARENKERVKAGKKMCLRCGRVKALKFFWKDPNISDGYKNACVPCDRERTREWTVRWNRKSRLEALTHYGSKCACCGEARFEFLAIDHVNGDGNKHRASGKFKPGSGFVKWLRRNGWPKGYRVLCNNCNQSLGNYGYCPHAVNGVPKV